MPPLTAATVTKPFLGSQKAVLVPPCFLWVFPSASGACPEAGTGISVGPQAPEEVTAEQPEHSEDTAARAAGAALTLLDLHKLCPCFHVLVSMRS